MFSEIGGIRGLVIIFALGVASAIGTVGQSRDSGMTAELHASRGLDLARKGDLQNAEGELRRALELAPRQASSHAHLGSILGLRGKLQEAGAYLQTAVELEPQNLDFRIKLGAIQWQTARFPEATENLDFVLEKAPDNFSAILLLGLVKESSGEFARAAELLSSVPALLPQQPHRLVALAHSYYKTGQTAKARETLQIFFDGSAERDWLEAGFVAAKMAADASDYGIAEELLNSIQTNYPDRLQLGYQVALVQYLDRRFEQSESTLLRLAEGGYADSRTETLLGKCYWVQNEPEKAAQAYLRALNLDPFDDSTFEDLSVLLAKTRLSGVTQSAVKSVVKRRPEHYRSWILKGIAELRSNEFLPAIESYSRAVTLNRRSAEALLGLAASQSLGGMTNDAFASYREGIRRFSNDARFFYGYSVLLLRVPETATTDAQARAEAMLRKSVALDSSFAAAHYLLGKLGLDSRRLPEALAELKLAAEGEPKNPSVHFALERVYRKLGQVPEALIEFELFQQLRNEEDESRLLFRAGGD